MNVVVTRSEAADTALFSRCVRREENRLYLHGTQLQFSRGESTLTSAGCKGLQLICYDPFTEQRKNHYVQHKI